MSSAWCCRSENKWGIPLSVYIGVDSNMKEFNLWLRHSDDWNIITNLINLSVSWFKTCANPGRPEQADHYRISPIISPCCFLALSIQLGNAGRQRLATEIAIIQAIRLEAWGSVSHNIVEFYKWNVCEDRQLENSPRTENLEQGLVETVVMHTSKSEFAAMQILSMLMSNCRQKCEAIHLNNYQEIYKVP